MFSFFNAISGPPDSFDPLDFDSANNVFLGRLLYATPLEFDQSGTLTSSVMEGFVYDSDSQTLTFKLKHGLTFQDGRSISPEDVAMAIKRMAYFRPHFPVIEKIVGLQAWRTGPNAFASLPDGMEIRGQDLKLRFSENIPLSLYRFTLELFAIIPVDCIDQATGKVKPGKPPESGHYKLFDGELKSRDWTFEARLESESMPPSISMHFYSWEESISKAVKAQVPSCVGGFGDVFLDPDKRTNLTKAGMEVVTSPKAWHLAMKLSSSVGGFKSHEVRKAFVTKLRHEMSVRYPAEVQLEESIFTPLHNCYVKYEPENPSLITEGSKSKVRDAFREGLVWVGKESYLSAVDDAVAATCEYFKIQTKKIGRADSANQRFHLFVGLTGFWSYDPFGDVKMLFTPNLHKQLQDIATDPKVQTALDALDSSSVARKADLAMALDRLIHDNYVYNVVAHFPFIFAFSGASKGQKKIPQSGILPYPWMLAK